MTKVVVIGAGGLGTPAAWGLLSGWPKDKPLLLDIVDPDHIELSNLNRQVLYREDSLGKPKASILAETLRNLFPKRSEIEIRGQVLSLGEENAQELLSDSNYVIDACDSTKTKFLLNDFCLSNEIAFCYAGVVGEKGLLLSVNASNTSPGGCLRCLFGDFDREEMEQQTISCQEAGIIGPLAGYLGFLQAKEALTHLLSETAALGGSKLLRYKFGDLSASESTVFRSADCPVCSKRVSQRSLDIRDQVCPSTFLYTKLAVEKISVGERLQVRFGNADSASRVARTIEELGHLVLERLTTDDDNEWQILIEKRHD